MPALFSVFPSGKEKKATGEGRQKTEEDIQSAEDRCNHLNKVKGKLEQSLDECEDTLEREKKAKGDVEKQKRKVEGDLKLTQEAVADLERINSELGQTVQRKDKEVSSIAAKIEDEQTLGSKYSKQVKELQARVDELDEELSVERNNRAKAEKNRSLLSRDLEDLGTRLAEVGSNTSTQIELNKKREGELVKLKADLDEANIAHEGTLAALRQKHNNSMAELGNQIDGINKNQAKSEKDKAGMERDLQEARAGLEEAMRDRANMEKNCKMAQGLIVESNQKQDELARALNDADSTKKKLLVESQDLGRQIEETENAIGALQKNKISLGTQLEDTKKLADGEARDRAALLTKFKSLVIESENLRMKIDEESEKKNDALKALSKVQSEIQLWKSKNETEALGHIDEFEGSKHKLGAKVAEAEENIESLNTKIGSAEKSAARMNSELEELAMEYERTHAAACITEKRGKNFDKVVGEWKAKADDFMAELDADHSEARNYSNERFRLKSALDESNEQLDIVRRENKNLADEIKDLLDQLGDGGCSVHKPDKQRRRMESEKEVLQSALEEAEGSLEAEENKELRAQLELGQVRQEIDRKIAEKKEEFNNTRENHARAMESRQASLETEQKAKAEGLRVKKKLEGNINEFEIALDYANKANNEALKPIKHYQSQLREAEVHYEEAARPRQEISEKASLAERRSNALQSEVEEARALLDSAERGKRQTEFELTEARMAVNEMNNVSSRAAADKRRLEGAVHTLQAEIDDMPHQAKSSEEKVKKAIVDAVRLADERRAEQDHVSVQSKAKRSPETTMADMENRLADANESAMKGGKAVMAELESRIRELETELDGVQARTSDNMKDHQKAEHKIKELAFQNDGDKKYNVPVIVAGATTNSQMAKHPKNLDIGEKKAWTGPDLIIDGIDAEQLEMGENVTSINWGNIMIKAENKGADRKAKSVEDEQNIDNKDYKKTMKLTGLCKDENNSPTTPTVLIYYGHIISRAILDEDDDFKSFIGIEAKLEIAMLGDPKLRDLEKDGYVAADGNPGAADAAQGDLIRKLKTGKAAKPEIDGAVKKQLAFKAGFKTATGSDWKPGATSAPAAASPPSSSGGSDIGAAVAAQGDLVRKLKSEKTAKPEIDEAVNKQLALKADHKSATGNDWKPGAAPAPAAAKSDGGAPQGGGSR